MTTPDTPIPPEAIKAAAREIALANGWKEENAVSICAPVAEAACRAMLENWPGMDTRPNIYGRQDAILILPLPQENTNDKG